MPRLILLTAPVTSSKEEMVLYTRPVDFETVRRLVDRAERVESYIGHPATAELLTRLLNREIPVNRGMYSPEPGDIAVVAKLKKRLERPMDVPNVTLDDLEFIVIDYMSPAEVSLPVPASRRLEREETRERLAPA